MLKASGARSSRRHRHADRAERPRDRGPQRGQQAQPPRTRRRSPYDGCIAVLKDAHAVYVLFIRVPADLPRLARRHHRHVPLPLRRHAAGFVFLDRFIDLSPSTSGQYPEPIRPLCALPRSEQPAGPSSFSVLAIGLLGMVASRPYFGRDLAHGCGRASRRAARRRCRTSSRRSSRRRSSCCSRPPRSRSCSTRCSMRALMLDMCPLPRRHLHSVGLVVSVVADERLAPLLHRAAAHLHDDVRRKPDLRAVRDPFTWFLSVIVREMGAEAYVVDELGHYENLYNLTTTYEMLMYSPTQTSTTTSATC